MQADQIMTSKVHTVRRDTSITDVAALMTAHRISGLPVVGDDGGMIGIISQTDLLHRAETGTEKKRKWWISAFIDADMRARDFIKAHGHTVGDAMSRFVISVPHDASLAQVADILDANNLKRVPVLKDGKLIGIITRGDIVRAFVDADAMQTVPQREPAALQKAINDALAAQSWVNPAFVNVVVTDATIQIWGFVASEDQRKALVILVEELAGHRTIDSHVGIGPRGRLSAA
jgi:CBS-domain-containing membrane protein